MMAIAYRDYVHSLPEVVVVTSYFLMLEVGQEVEFGMRWLLKMWNNTAGNFFPKGSELIRILEVLYYQVGIGSGNSRGTFQGDHDLWRLPQADDALNVQPGNSLFYIKYR
jgi:endoglucanase